MQITSAVFIKGVVGPDPILADGKPHVAFIGRSNVGKSSTINALTRSKGLARTSSVPGHTRELNVYLINKKFYLVDLPGYGFAQSSKGESNRQRHLINWYLFESPYIPAKVVQIIDAKVGATAADLEILAGLEEKGYEVIVAPNKIDRLGPNAAKVQVRAIQDRVGRH